jgi:alpha-L-rhamnosidase
MVNYAGLSEHVRAAWQAEYLDDAGRLTPHTQANHVRALAFDLVPEQSRKRVGAGWWSSSGKPTPSWAPDS